jgi:hypothetical protein
MNKYISIKVILDNILDHPLLRDVSTERVINHAVNFMRIVGCPKIYNDKIATISITNYRGSLPEDFDEVIQVRYNHNNESDYSTFRSATDTFFMNRDNQNDYYLTYKIQGGVIFTSIKEGNIEMSYRAIPICEEGYPMIPDNSSFIRALELYIKKQCFTVLFDLGKITPAAYNNVLQEYAWAVGQAQSDLVRPTLDEMQSITNMWNKLLPINNESNKEFRNLGVKSI